MGISAGLGALTVNTSTQNSGNTEDRVSYGAAYTIGGLFLVSKEMIMMIHHMQLHIL